MKNQTFVNTIVILLVATFLVLLGESIYLITVKGYTDISQVIAMALILATIGVVIGRFIIPTEETFEVTLEEGTDELEFYLEKIATNILRANDVEFNDPKQESECPTYAGLQKIESTDAQRLATIRIADENKVLISYVLYFIGEDYANVAWFERE